MKTKLIFFIVLFFQLFLEGNTQVLPYYSASGNFYANQVKAICGSGSNSYTLPSTFPISTASHRMPFYAVMAVQNFTTELNEYMYFWTELRTYTSTSMIISIYFLERNNSGVITYFGFAVPSYVNIRYLLVKNTFPNKFISTAIMVTGVNYALVAGGSKTLNFNVLSIVNPAPLTLSANDTIYIHSFSDATLVCDNSPVNNTFELTARYSTINATYFSVTLNTKVPITIQQVQIKVFIYNKADFDNLYVKIDYQKFSYSGLLVGNGLTIVQSYTASYTGALTTDILFGIQGIYFSGYQFTGFTFTIDSTGGSNYNITLTNLMSTSTIPRLDLLVLLPSQFRCPYLQLLIDVTLQTCYNTSCPTSTFKSTQVIGVTGIYVCQPCISTCYACSILANNCTSCYATQNRQLNGTNCVPMPGFYEALIDVAPPCDKNCLTCNSTAIHCTSCNSTMYLSASNVCTNCSTIYVGCIACTSIKCTTCDTGYSLTPNGNTCIACISFDPNCINCTATACTTCNTGYMASANGLTCITCSTFDLNCATCTSSACTSCNSAAGYFFNSKNLCTSCQTYNSQCSSCDAVACLSCLRGNFLALDGSCQSCTIYGQQCLDCNSSSCVICSQGYSVYQSTCQSLNPVCGDGLWIDTLQACDDGNLLNGDGCDSQCQVQPDYVCLIADKLPSGASYCKYTKNITVNFNSLSKDISSNTLHVFLNVGPSTFNQWTQQSIMDLISPIQIVDTQTGAVKQIPFSSINLIYHQNQQTGQVQVIIDYGQNNLQNSFIQLNIQPNLTNLSALQNLPSQNNIQIKLNSQGYGFYLYDYPSDTYETQSFLQTLSTVVGILSLLLALLGLCIPAGKLIILEALAVIQLGYFSLLQFDMIPPTFAGLKSLSFCNGFNDLSLFSSSQIRQNIFKIIGLKTISLINDNISLVMFVFFPALIGLIGYLVQKRGQDIEYKKVRRNSETTEDVKNDEISKQTPTNQTQQNQGPKLGQVIFERIMYENTFYGLVFGGYLGWISILHSFSQPSLFDYVFTAIITILWIGYGYLYVRNESNQINSSEFSQKTQNKLKKPSKNDLKISTQFGQFADVHRQLMPAAQSIFMKRIYLFFMGERLLNSLILVFLPDMMSFTSSILMSIYLFQLIGMIVLYKKFQTDQANSKGTMFSYIYQNYVLRQSVNFLTIILIQALYMSVNVIVQSTGPYQAFVHNELVTKGVPFAILSLLFLNMGFNVFCWIWELKSDRLIDKAKIILAHLFPQTFSSLSKNQDLTISVIEQQQVERVMNKFIESSSIFKCKQNPFIGIQQKQTSKNALLDLMKIQQKRKIDLPQSAKNLKSQMINELWQQI